MIDNYHSVHQRTWITGICLLSILTMQTLEQGGRWIGLNPHLLLLPDPAVGNTCLRGRYATTKVGIFKLRLATSVCFILVVDSSHVHQNFAGWGIIHERCTYWYISYKVNMQVCLRNESWWRWAVMWWCSEQQCDLQGGRQRCRVGGAGRKLFHLLFIHSNWFSHGWMTLF